MSMKLEQVLRCLFDNDYDLESNGDFFFGTANLNNKKVTIIGTTNGVTIGVELLLAQSRVILNTIKHHPGQPIFFLIDTRGPKLQRLDELLGLNRYMAHMGKCIELARQNGHPTVGIVYGEAVAGGFICSGLLADQCYAMSSAMISVMNLPAMARIMKTPLEKLIDLAKINPVFAPGLENYYKMGAIQEIWQENLHTKLSSRLCQALEELPSKEDQRLELGFARGGRQRARLIVENILKDG